MVRIFIRKGNRVRRLRTSMPLEGRVPFDHDPMHTAFTVVKVTIVCSHMHGLAVVPQQHIAGFPLVRILETGYPLHSSSGVWRSESAAPMIVR